MSEEGKDYLNRMLNASQRMQTLIEDLLTFSRLSQSQTFYKIDLNKLLEEVLSDLEVAIENSKTKIEVAELPIIEAEAVQMRQLFQNLISNAIKFRKDNETPIIKIYCKKISPATENEMVEIYFEDNGIGFDEKYNDRIFNIFQRLEGKKYAGSGIGLAICRKIARRHGGNIIAQSKEGKGSTFIVTLAVKHKNDNDKINHQP